MSSTDTILLNDDLFLNSVSCPLKYQFKREEYEKRIPSKLLFRQRNKLHLRDAVAMRYPHRKKTSKSLARAAAETEEWLNMREVAICGAVLAAGEILTRIPLLVKKGNDFKIIQVHGRLRKRGEANEIRQTGTSRSLDRNLLKAAYRMEVLKRIYPDASIDVDFYFPKRSFRSDSNNLHLYVNKESSGKKEKQVEIERLFAAVSATGGTNEMSRSLAESLVHESFAGQHISSAVGKVLTLASESQNIFKITRHAECKRCPFRLKEDGDGEGCWSRNFPEKGIKNSEKHIYELIGQEYDAANGSDIYYQEQADPVGGFEDFDKIRNYGGEKITIKQRKSLQILLAKGGSVPKIWLKKGCSVLNELRFPLHFLDFEAAAYAIPFKKQAKPYDPVYFQFSCHSLREDGSLMHTEWLDEKEPHEYPHERFVDALEQVPEITRGTIVQYSPFEWQAINRLIKEYGLETGRETRKHRFLQLLRDGEKRGNRHRFFDFSNLVRDFYFNAYMQDGIGLKPVLLAILEWEHERGSSFISDVESNGKLHSEQKTANRINPYKNIQHSGYMISDGASAMSAWISGKLGLLNEEEKKAIPQILRNYCNLDSISLYVIYRHITGLMESSPDEDLVIYGSPNGS